MFKYKKTKYENIYSWAKNSDARCFYCKDEENSELAFEILDGKGICKSCLDQFEVGQLGTDRHVIERIMPDFKKYKEAAEWFSKYGKMVLADIMDLDDGKIYIYHFINDSKTYNEMQK